MCIAQVLRPPYGEMYIMVFSIPDRIVTQDCCLAFIVYRGREMVCQVCMCVCVCVWGGGGGGGGGHGPPVSLHAYANCLRL